MVRTGSGVVAFRVAFVDDLKGGKLAPIRDRVGLGARTRRSMRLERVMAEALSQTRYALGQMDSDARGATPVRHSTADIWFSRYENTSKGSNSGRQMVQGSRIGRPSWVNSTPRLVLRSLVIWCPWAVPRQPIGRRSGTGSYLGCRWPVGRSTCSRLTGNRNSTNI